MIENKFIRTLSCLSVVVLMACGTAFAQQGKLMSGPYQGPKVPMGVEESPAAGVFYTNFTAVDPCNTCSYGEANGFLMLGPANCGISGATQWLAYPFVSLKTGAVRKVITAITDWSICTPTSHNYTVAIYSDSCPNGVPGTQIGNSVVATTASAPCLTSTANFGHAAVSLVAGTRYWVVVTTSTAPTQTATTAVWWEINGAEGSFNLNDGNGWLAGPTGAPGAFSVQ
jgi:hypothetical protein